MKKILLDTDAGVDDILALLLLLRSPDLAQCVGVTIVAGNTELPNCIANVARAMGVAARYNGGLGPVDFPIAAGADAPLSRPLFQAAEVHGPDGLGGTSFLKDDHGAPRYPETETPLDPRAGHDLILDLAAAYPGEITLVAIGPLTNLALAFQKDAARFRQLNDIVLMGGTFLHDGNTSPRTEFNIFVDPEAAQIVLNSGVPITIVPLDCSEQTRLLATDTRGEGPVHRFVQDATGPINRFHQEFEGFDGCFHHDPLALGIAMDATLATGVHTRVMVETRGEYTSGETVAGLRPNRPLLPGEPNALVCLRPEAARFEKLFLDRVLPPGA